MHSLLLSFPLFYTSKRDRYELFDCAQSVLLAAKACDMIKENNEEKLFSRGKSPFC